VLAAMASASGASTLGCSKAVMPDDPGHEEDAGTPAWSLAGTPPSFAPRRAHLGLVFDNRIWIMGGEDTGGDALNDVWASTDGATWSQVTAAAAWSARESPAGTVYKNKMWLIDGAREGDVWTSTDGATWTAIQQVVQFPPRYGHCSLVFKDKLWIIGGYGDQGEINDVWSSTDGATWSQVTAAAAWSPRADAGCVVKDGKMWVIDGTRAGDVWTSTDGATWTAVAQTKPFIPSLMVPAVVWRGEIWTLGGYDNTGQDNNAVFHSPNGAAWTRMLDVPWSPRTYGAAVVFDDKVWLIDGNPRLGEVWKLEVK
jgi:N-acetylneuraminic acid mutarotase